MTLDPDRAAKLIRMLSSANEGEVLNAARLLTKMGIHDVAAMVGGLPHQRVAPPAPSSASRKTSAGPAEHNQIVALFTAAFPELALTRNNLRSIDKFIAELDLETVEEAANIAIDRMDADRAFRYFCGICWARIKEARL